MTRIYLDEVSYALQPGESVLECLERYDVALPSSCRSGTCQSCLIQASEGTVPPTAQTGLKEAWIRQNYLLACVCRPTEELSLRRLGEAETTEAKVVGVERLTDTVTRLRLGTTSGFAFEAGQYVTLLRSDGIARSYSIASLPTEDCLEFHVRCVPGGRMSTWIHNEVEVGHALRMRGPQGDCFYVAGNPEEPILLCGTGTGLAPLWGILRQALVAEHRGPITLVHGARTRDGLYLQDELSDLAKHHRNVSYIPCVLEGGDAQVIEGRVDELAFEALRTLGAPATIRAYLCGDPNTVQGLRRRLFLGGMSMSRIAMDPFIVAPPKASAKPAAAATS